MSEKELDVVNGDVDITSFTPKQQRFFHLYISGRYTNTKIAELLGVHQNTISNWLRDPNMGALVDKYQEEEYISNKKKLKALSTEAIVTMSELLDSPIDGIRYQSAKDILDRTDFKPVAKKEVKTETYSYETQISKIIDRTVTDDDLLEAIEGVDYEVLDNDG